MISLAHFKFVHLLFTDDEFVVSTRPGKNKTSLSIALETSEDWPENSLTDPDKSPMKGSLAKQPEGGKGRRAKHAPQRYDDDVYKKQTKKRR